MTAKKGERLAVFYDGACPVCSREMEQYRRRDRSQVLELVDIAAPGFKAEDYGRTQEAFIAQLHVRDAEGRFYTGVDAFVRIWQAMPQTELHLLAVFVGLPGVNLLARGGYRLFARYRHLLPKRKTPCDDGTCNLGHHR